MYEKLQLCGLVIAQTLQLVAMSGSLYLHEPSFKHLRCADTSRNSDFGYSIAYQDSKPPHVLIGAPHDQPTGNVFKCAIDDLFCSKLDIDVAKLAPSEGDFAMNRSSCLGASLIATPNFFVTCAPLWTTQYDENFENGIVAKQNAFGRCFVYDTKARMLADPLDHYINLEEVDITYEGHDGGTGWNLHMQDDGVLISQSANIGSFYKVTKDETHELLVDDDTYIDFQIDTSKYRNIGRVSAFGAFLGHLPSDGTYAISMTDNKMFDYVGIFNSNAKLIVELEERIVNTMFGSALHMSDIDRNNFTDLLVGAPAHHDDEFGYEKGAVHIYLGGHPDHYEPQRSTILALKDGSRFGSTIATSDMDGDGLPEIFVSAPYEESGNGALYILSGLEIKRKLLGEFKTILLSELILSQRLHNKYLKSFAFSLQPILDVDSNGCGEIVVGSPGSATVTLYKCVPTVFINVTAERIGEGAVKVNDLNFTVHVCIYVDFRFVYKYATTKEISTQLELKYSIIGPNVYIDADESVSFLRFTDIVNGTYCNNVSVHFVREVASTYNFTTEVTAHNEDIEEKEFNPNWVTLSPESVTTTSLQVERKCNDIGNCVPKFNVNLSWTGGSLPYYEVGLSEKENLTINVHNVGTYDAYESCVSVVVSGALLYNSECTHHLGRYLCQLPKPLKKNAVYEINMQLQMNNLSSNDDNLFVEATAYGICNQHNTAMPTKALNQTYLWSGKGMEIIRTYPKDYNVTKKDFKENKIKCVHEYKIINKCFLTWKNVHIKILTKYDVFVTITDINGESSKECVKHYNETDTVFVSNCTVDLMSFTATVINVTQIITEKQIGTVGSKLNITSDLFVHLKTEENTRPDMIKHESVTSIYIFQQDSGIWEDKSLVFLIAILIALLVLAVILFILYKLGFFKRKKKTQLKELRRQSTLRRESLNHKPANVSTVDESDNVDLVIEEMCQPQNSPICERKV